MGTPRDGSPRNHRRLADLLETEPRCIYCGNTRETATMTREYMPPRSMFRDRHRLKGMEYAVCEPCNNGTKGADVVASFMARIGQESAEGGWEIRENTRFLSGLEQSAPGVREELFDDAKAETIYVRTSGGIVLPKVRARANGPLLTAYMNVFAAKLAMAMYREKTGAAIPLEGRIETIVFFNAGLAQQTAETILAILPAAGALVQGTQNSLEQFAYRFNSDDREIVAALVGFHNNLHIMVLATANPIFEQMENRVFSNQCRPGQLLDMLPRKKRFVLPGLPGGRLILN